MTRFLVATVLLLACALPVEAWYEWNGYWYQSYDNNAQAYTRTATYHNPYWSCGVYYHGYYSYSYTPYYSAAYVAPAQDFDTQLLAIARLKVTEDAKLAKLRAVGVTLTKEELFRFAPQAQGGGYGYPYGSYHAYQQFTPVQASYSYNSAAALYGDTNLNQLYLLQAQAVSQAGKLFSEANGLFATNVQTAGNNAAAVARINATAQATVAFAKSLQAPAVIETRGIKWSGGVGEYPRIDNSAATPQTKEGILTAWVALCKNKCASCHLGADAKGKFDLETYPVMTAAERERRVYPRIDPGAADNFRMPRSANGTPGLPLTAQELQLFMLVSAPDAPATPRAEPLPAPQVDKAPMFP